MLFELNIKILSANSSRAKGGVERANRTLRDQLVNEFRLAGISDIDKGNTFCPSSWKTLARSLLSPAR